MAIDKVKLPDSSTQDIHDSRIQGIDSTPTTNSTNLVTSGGVKSALSGYLPLSGGTLTGLLRISSDNDSKIIFDNTDNETNYQQIVFSQNGTEYARLGTFGNTILRWQLGQASYKIWHEGNDGSGSGLDADLLDGKHNGDLYANGLRDYEHHDYGTRRTSGNITYADTALHYYLATAYMTDAGRPGADGYIMHLGWDNARFDSQLWIATNDTAASQGGAHMKVRHHNNGADDSSWGDWHSVAMTDSNVASASKLLTPRSIWGQSFDGSGNVDGNITINGRAYVSSGLSVGTNHIGVSNRATLSLITPGDYPNDLVLGSSGQNQWSITSRASNQNNSFGLYSYVKSDYALYANHLCNVGIGTLSPAYKLDVAGVIHASGDILLTTLRATGNIFAASGNTGIYLSRYGINVHNANDGWVTDCVTFDLSGNATFSHSATTILQTSQPSGGMLPNREYKLGTLSSATTFTLAAETSGVTNHYFWTFETGSTAPTITWPAAITSWAGGSAPSINSNRHYEVSVLNGVAVVLEV